MRWYFACFVCLLICLKCDQWLSKKKKRICKKRKCVQQSASRTVKVQHIIISFLIFHFLEVSLRLHIMEIAYNNRTMVTTTASQPQTDITRFHWSCRKKKIYNLNRRMFFSGVFFSLSYFVFLRNKSISYINWCISDAVLTMTFNAGLVVCYCLVGLANFVLIAHAGPIDAALNWARADKLPIEIDVNLPWLPCKWILTF